MDRYTIKDAELALDRLLLAIGGQRAQSYQDVGGYRLDYNTAYGGCVVERIVSLGGAVTRPFGDQRFTPREFYNMVYFTMRTLEESDRIALGTTRQAC